MTTKKLLEQMASMSMQTEEAQILSEMAEMDVILQEMFKEGKYEEVAELITTFVNPNHVSRDYVSLLLNTISRKPGDVEIRNLRSKLKVQTLVPGAIHDGQEIKVKSTAQYALDGSHLKVSFSTWDLKNGDIGSLASIRREMRATLRDFYINKVFNALTDVWNDSNSSENHTSVANAVTATVLEDAIDWVNENSGGVRSVMGTRKAMTPMSKFGAFWDDGTTFTEIPSTIEEIKQTGLVGKYYGAPLIAFGQEYDNPVDYRPIGMPDNKILVVGNKVGDFVTYGNAESDQYIDKEPTPAEWVLKLWQQFSVNITNTYGIYVIEIT